MEIICIPLLTNKTQSIRFKTGFFELGYATFATENLHRNMEGKAPLTYEIASTSAVFLLHMAASARNLCKYTLLQLPKIASEQSES